MCASNVYTPHFKMSNVLISPDRSGGGEDQTENRRSHPQREVPDLSHPLHPQPFCHRRPGRLLLQHLLGHHLLPGKTDERHEGSEMTTSDIIPRSQLLPATSSNSIVSGNWKTRSTSLWHFFCFAAGEFHCGSHLRVPSLHCYHPGQLHHPPPLLCHHQFWGLLAGLRDPLHSHEVLWTHPFLLQVALLWKWLAVRVEHHQEIRHKALIC